MPKIRARARTSSGLSSERVSRPRTIANLWRDAAAAGHPDPAYLFESDGEWRELARSEAVRTVDELANGLLALGVRKGDAFGLLARTSVEWALFDFALALVGAVGAPIYASSSPRDAQYVLDHSGAVGVLVEDEEQRAKLGGFRGHVLAFPELDELRARGRAFAAVHPGELAARADSVEEDDLFTFIYTSGTTGPPKACMIRHRNYYAMVQKGDEMEGRLTEPGDVMLLYLPLAHNYGRLLHLSAACSGGASACPPHPLPERAEGVREDPHRRRRRVRASDRRAQKDRRLGTRHRQAGLGAPPGRRAGSRVAGAP